MAGCTEFVAGRQAVHLLGAKRGDDASNAADDKGDHHRLLENREALHAIRLPSVATTLLARGNPAG